MSVAHAQGLTKGLGPTDIATYTTGPALPADDALSRLPEVLSDGDVVLYRRILSAQTDGDFATADKLIDALGDRRLMGHVLAERYLSKGYKTTYREAHAWLTAYRGQAETARMVRLASGKKKAGDPALPKGVAASAGFSRSGDEDMSWRDKPYRSSASGAAALEAKVTKALRAGKVEDVASILAASGVEDPILLDQQRGRAALRAFQAGKDALAVSLGQAAAKSADKVPDAAWFGGLAAWRQGRRAEAAQLFEAVAASTNGSSWTNAAGAFWAGRAYKAVGKKDKSDQMFARAAESPHSLHGLLARRSLGWDMGLDWELPSLKAREVGQLKDYPSVARALALVQVGRREIAEAELRAALPKLPEDLALSMLTLAERGGMPGLAMSVAGGLLREKSQRFDAGLYPIPPWAPTPGFAVNPALVYAIAKVESHFDPTVSNASGATGLMQLMPGTAKAMTKMGRPVRFDGPDDLYDPALSLTLGQRLLHTLLTHKSVKGDLIKLTIAYNGGIGNMEKWVQQAKAGRDPLLLIEAIPSAETRNFTARSLHNYFLYQMRLGQQTDGLTQLAAGKSPTYVPGQYAPQELASIR
ncbi:lytic transglycosylase domain-containing protein [Lacibacterium aquatile]|uniref:Lytic transglycosylase domain-containing protein n=1 Tax=Lacibacterium aquatile TaxID=1168082 RepID=A0ABW5DQ86_9PROT